MLACSTIWISSSVSPHSIRASQSSMSMITSRFPFAVTYRTDCSASGEKANRPSRVRGPARDVRGYSTWPFPSARCTPGGATSPRRRCRTLLPGLPRPTRAQSSGSRGTSRRRGPTLGPNCMRRRCNPPVGARQCPRQRHSRGSRRRPAKLGGPHLLVSIAVLRHDRVRVLHRVAEEKAGVIVVPTVEVEAAPS